MSENERHSVLIIGDGRIHNTIQVGSIVEVIDSFSKNNNTDEITVIIKDETTVKKKDAVEIINDIILKESSEFPEFFELNALKEPKVKTKRYTKPSYHKKNFYD